MCSQKQSRIFKVGDLSIFEAYKISVDDAEVQILEFGTWENGGGGGGGELLLAAGADKNIWRRRADLKGKHLRLAMPIYIFVPKNVSFETNHNFFKKRL